MSETRAISDGESPSAIRPMRSATAGNTAGSGFVVYVNRLSPLQASSISLPIVSASGRIPCCSLKRLTTSNTNRAAGVAKSVTLRRHALWQASFVAHATRIRSSSSLL